MPPNTNNFSSIVGHLLQMMQKKIKVGLYLKDTNSLTFFRSQDLLPNHGKVYIFKKRKIYPELYCNLTAAE